MKRICFLSIILFAIATTSLAQDYEVRSIEHLPMDMTAKINNLTERPNGGQYCAVLRIATQNILAKDRNDFQFRPDMGSHIRERRNEGGEILLWVSPGINYLTIKHKDLGNMLIFIPELLHGEVESLNTYRILIVGTKELPKEPVAYGKCQMVFLPHPEDAVLFINGDSIGTGSHTITSLSGNYHWKVEHPLYQTEEGTVELTKGKIDSIYVNLIPTYGYIRIMGDDKDGGKALKVYIDGEPKGDIPFTSGKLAAGIYEVTLKSGDTIKAKSQIEVKKQQISINQTNDLIWYYERALYINKRLNDFNKTNNLLGGADSTNNSDDAIDSLVKARRTRYYPITGKVTIHSTPNAWVAVDSVRYGLTPVTIDSLAVGPHQLEIAAGNYTTINQEINVVEDNVISYSFQLNHECVATIISDRPDDQVFVDGEYVGKTPVTITRPFGTYSIRIKRPIGYNLKEEISYSLEEEISLNPDDLEPTIYLPLGHTVHIETGNKRAKLFRDNSYIGRTPMDLFIANGHHTISVEHGWKEGEKEITISKDNHPDDLNIEPQLLSMSSFMRRGAFFMTGNMAFMNTAQPVYGFNIGDICNGGTAGWYFSLYANRTSINQFLNRGIHMFDEKLEPDTEESGNVSDKRASVIFGVIIGGPVYLRFGAGAGIRYYWEKNKEGLYDPYSWKGFECSLGLQACIYNFVINTDVLLPGEVLSLDKGLVEFRVGLGYCLKHTMRE